MSDKKKTSKNEIDEKIIKSFPKKILKNLESNNLDYFGINISSNPEKDFAFKLYYKNKYSQKLYSKSKKIPLIEFALENKMTNFIQIVHDKNHIDCSRYNINLTNQTNRNMELLYSFLKENCSFYEKYEKEILELAKMKIINATDKDYCSFFFIALLNYANESILKCYWYNQVCNCKAEYFNNNEYYIDFIEKCNVDGLKKILPTAKRALKNCVANLWMEGIDYTISGLKKYKIYLREPQKPYEGLIKTYSRNKEIKKKIKIIEKWNNIHKEIYCAGFAIGKDINKHSTINFYFRSNKKISLED